MNDTTSVKVEMQTNKGTIELELYRDKAPATTENFIMYAKDGFYDGTIFHRVIPGFMIQGGGFSPDMSEKATKASIKNEANNGLKNVTGSIAMARTPDPHSASSQFFISVKDNHFLDHTSETQQGWGYAVFGQVTGGMEVLESIAAVPTGNHGGHQDVPKDPVTIEKITITE
ncbi:MAG: peptidylprolyl isomerase [Pseudomonadota bacterium]|nr:peptidylprolyl isomerase [Pseudomonadota bacterium]